MLARAWDVDSALGGGAERFGEIGRQVLNADSAHLAVLNGLLHHGRRHCNRHRQVDTDTATGRRDDGSVDPEKAAVGGDPRITGITRVIRQVISLLQQSPLALPARPFSAVKADDEAQKPRWPPQR